MEPAADTEGWRLVEGTLDRLEKVVSVDRPGMALLGMETPYKEENAWLVEALASRAVGVTAAGLEATGGGCQAEVREGVDRSGSRMPLMPRLSGGKLLGDSFFRELGRLNRASAEKGDILEVSERGVLLRPPPVLRSRLASAADSLPPLPRSSISGRAARFRGPAATELWTGGGSSDDGCGGWGGGRCGEIVRNSMLEPELRSSTWLGLAWSAAATSSLVAFSFNRSDLGLP